MVTTPIVERVQDTARWVAMARALESERPDRLFDDPFARKLAGPRGEELVKELSPGASGTWPIVTRTHIIDQLVAETVRAGVDAVVNLAAGLDSRPYRLALPSKLTWIEVDLADVIEAKAEALRQDTPACRLERIASNLADVEERARLFAQVRERFQRTLVITEGLLCYLPPEAALGLGQALLSMHPYRWVTDLNNTAVNRYVAKQTRHGLQGTAVMQFGVDDGTSVFEAMGWRTIHVDSTAWQFACLENGPEYG